MGVGNRELALISPPYPSEKSSVFQQNDSRKPPSNISHPSPCPRSAKLAGAHWPMAESLADFLTTNFQAHATGRAFGQRCGYRMKWWSYAQILDIAFRFAHELQARDIGKGDRVM